MKASSWKSNQRTLRKKGKLDQYKIDSLNKLGMVWNPREDEWEKKYLHFRKKGFCYGLEVWITEQRELYHKEQIPIENLQRLKSINFPFKEEKNEQFPFTYECYNSLSYIYLDESVKAWKKEESTKASKKEGDRISEEYAHSEAGKIRDTIYLALRRINESFIKNLHKISYKESISLIDKILDGENVFINDFIIGKHSQHIINNNGLKGKFGNPKYYSSNSSQQNLFKPTEKFDIELCRILSIPNPNVNRKLDGSEIYYYLKYFNKQTTNPLVRKYCCENMLNFFETISSERMRSFAPLDYLIPYYESEKNIDKILKLKNYIEKYPLLSYLYNDKIDKILTKL